MNNAPGIIIPVYANLALTRQCVESVLSNLRPNDQVLLIDDASPEVALRDYCQSLRDHPSVTVIVHDNNRGFVQSVNEGFAHFIDRDVIILNSDTRVSSGWLDKLQTIAVAETDIATVTPLSNNAEIASYPVFCQDNALPAGVSLSMLNRMAEKVNSGAYVTAPTGVGFCLYIKRTCLDEVGAFNSKAFGKGYGEENDFCLRATERGWRHVIAMDTFVYHKGGASFAANKVEAMHRAGNTIANMYPNYHQLIQDYIQRDPLRPYREALDKALQDITVPAAALMPVSFKVKQGLLSFAGSARPRVLYVTHCWGGGVEQHIQDLLALLDDDLDILVLRGGGQGGVEIDVPTPEGRQAFKVGGFDAASLAAWVGLFQSLNFSRVHVHHVHGWPSCILDFILALETPVDITAHDYYLVSPSYHMTATGPSQNDDSWPRDASRWRHAIQPLLDKAERVIAPSSSVASELSHHFPQAQVVPMPHPERLERYQHLRKVLLVGALSPEKGLEVVAQVSRLAAAECPGLTFSLVGYPSTPLNAPVAISGNYEGKQLPRLLAAEKPDCVWFPAQVPETFNYALSHAMALGVPIVASNIGAFPDRLHNYPAAQLVAPDATAEQWLAALGDAVGLEKPAFSVAIVKDNLDTYRCFYLDVVWQRPATTVPISGMQLWEASLQAFPATENTPIKNLYDFAAYCRHQGKIDEIRHRLSALADDEAEVIGAREARARHRDYLSVMADLTETRKALDQRQIDLEAATRQVAEQAARIDQYQDEVKTHQSNLKMAQDNIATMQQQARSAQAYIDFLEERINFYVYSYSWRITRPFRVLARLLKATPAIARQLLHHLMSVRSYRKLAWFVYRGHFRLLAQRILDKCRSLATAQEAGAPPAVKSLPLVEETEEVMTPLAFPVFEAPEVSVLIPVYGQERTTYQCLKSILENPPARPYEVIVSDDCSPEVTEQVLSMVSGVRFVRQSHNLGFLRNVNAGSENACGKLLIILNNDTLVTRGALDALVAPLERDESVGLVGAKLINADGSLQEAGGIIWRDASGWNWGRDQNPCDPAFNYYREVDYCSGAALALQLSLFHSLGGFDEHYQPAYYEDTDLAFKIRERGMKVIYQPEAAIYHLEGVSHGKNENQGIKAYQSINAEKFRQRWQSVLKTHQENGLEPVRALRRYNTGTILIVEACMITPDQDSGSVRLFNLMGLLRGEGYHVIFVPENLEYREKPVKALQALGIEVLYGEWARSVKQVIRRYGPQVDAIMLCRHYVACNVVEWARQYAPQASLIFDTVDLHFVREEREAQVSGKSLLLAQAAQTRKQELALIRRCDITLVVSEYEQRLLSELVPEARVEIVSNIHAHTPERPGYAERQGIIFVGGFRHTPNIDAINWYLDAVVPLLREKLPGVETSVVGSNMPDSIRNRQVPGVRMLGFVEDIEPLLQRARVSIAPLRYGAGVKGKVNEAMNYGIPVVATECAVEGMHLRYGEDVLVADTAESFVEAIVRVYHDEDLWNQLSTAGIENIAKHFSPASAVPAVKRMLEIGRVQKRE